MQELMLFVHLFGSIQTCEESECKMSQYRIIGMEHSHVLHLIPYASASDGVVDSPHSLQFELAIL